MTSFEAALSNEIEELKAKIADLEQANARLTTAVDEQAKSTEYYKGNWEYTKDTIDRERKVGNKVGDDYRAALQALGSVVVYMLSNDEDFTKFIDGARLCDEDCDR